jgi:hypothetical protein
MLRRVHREEVRRLSRGFVRRVGREVVARSVISEVMMMMLVRMGVIARGAVRLVGGVSSCAVVYNSRLTRGAARITLHIVSHRQQAY